MCKVCAYCTFATKNERKSPFLITMPKLKNGERVLIEFEGTKQAAEVYVNGKQVGISENGIMAFGFDITNHTAVAHVDLPQRPCDTGAWLCPAFYQWVAFAGQCRASLVERLF